MDTIIDDALRPLVVALQDLQTCRYVYLSALAILVWAYVLTFEEERRCMWGTRLRLLQALFYTNRYLPIAFQVFNVVGDANAANTSAAATQWTIAAAIVTYRVWALYQANRLVKTFIIVLWGVATCGVIVLSVISLLGHPFVSDLPFGLRVCYPAKPLELTWAPFLPPLIFDAVAFTLALCKLVQHNAFMSTLRDSQVNRQIYNVMARDSTLYFVVILATNLVNVLLEAPFARVGAYSLLRIQPC
ncbi:hypothetical protein EXIGLDRAFT_832323 [Exidia glandulosa HHB12029]|uniref:DUF6533 domain-containing protein n=1 Tax=Exidia glandulosa HHB12029 TaxID=1314781 RepID=A0A165LRP9_EXIGL|nr:hypothetical protein EXIGLDRAFT_832323 [Exidia glandulosa HHB12029]